MAELDSERNIKKGLDIMILKRILFILLTLITCSGFIFNSGWKKHVPDEFKSFGKPDVIYLVDGTHFFGPGGINDAFVVYSLSDDVLAKIEKDGLSYLQNLPSTKKYEEVEKHSGVDKLKYNDQITGRYKDWRATPLASDNKTWREYQYMGRAIPSYDGKVYSCTNISTCSFYGDFEELPTVLEFMRYSDGSIHKQTLEDLNFIDEIKPEYIKMVDTIMNNDGGYYGYSEDGFFIISPSQRKMFLLYRN